MTIGSRSCGIAVLLASVERSSFITMYMSRAGQACSVGGSITLIPQQCLSYGVRHVTAEAICCSVPTRPCTLLLQHGRAPSVHFDRGIEQESRLEGHS